MEAFSVKHCIRGVLHFELSAASSNNHSAGSSPSLAFLRRRPFWTLASISLLKTSRYTNRIHSNAKTRESDMPKPIDSLQGLGMARTPETMRLTPAVTPLY